MVQAPGLKLTYIGILEEISFNCKLDHFKATGKNRVHQ
jgi:hypothetical protein